MIWRGLDTDLMTKYHWGRLQEMDKKHQDPTSDPRTLKERASRHEYQEDMMHKARK